jgi:toxin CptA
MSIALSAIVRPSRLLRRALVGCALTYAVLGAALIAGLAGPVIAPVFLGISCLLAALAALHTRRGMRTAHQIDVSGLGELRLTVQHHSAISRQPAVLMRLAPGCTIWPGLLVLLLRPHGEGGAAALQALLVLPDSMTPEQFRALTVACRSIAKRDNKFVEKNKIV